jgi:hypothetical protein
MAYFCPVIIIVSMPFPCKEFLKVMEKPNVRIFVLRAKIQKLWKVLGTDPLRTQK